MLWLDTHKPRSFDEITSHGEVKEMLSRYSLDSVPNLILHGQDGHNKKTILYALIAHLYGTYPKPTRKTVEMKINGAIQTVDYLESDEMVEICPSEYGNRDRHVVQHIIKSMAETRPVMSLFGERAHSVKIVVIDRAEDLSRDAQAALRRTMEVYSGHFRLFMMCTELSRLIEPIRSRSLFMRMRGFSEAEIMTICERILEKEGMEVEGSVLGDIARNADGDCKRALCILELYCFNREEPSFKKQRQDLANFRLGWEEQILEIARIICDKPRVENFVQIRKELYSLLGACIPASTILLMLTRRLSNQRASDAETITKLALIYDQRIRLGSKHLFHLEAFAASAMSHFAKRA